MIVRSHLCLLVSLAAAGCAPPTFIAGLPWTVQQYRVADAKAQVVRSMPYLRMNALLTAELNAAVEANDPPEAMDKLKLVFEDSYRLARQAQANEIDCLPPAAQDDLWRRHFAGEYRPVETRAAIRERFLQEIEAEYQVFQKGLADRTTVAEMRRLAEEIRWLTSPSPKSKHGRGLLLAMIIALTSEEHGAAKPSWPQADLYLPNEDALAIFAAGDAGLPSPQAKLLARYAPRILQERKMQERYDPKTDMIGTVRLSGKPKHIEVRVDTTIPSVYTYWQHTLIHGRRYLQLVYVYWFSQRPSLRLNDDSAGHIDGATLRITLDSADRPVLFETIKNSGFHHRCYPSSRLEEEARREYTSPASRKTFCVGRKMAGTPDWIVDRTVDLSADDNDRPILFSRAGHHRPQAVGFDQMTLSLRQLAAPKKYTLRWYDELENLPTPFGAGSMFGPDGLVHGAGRPAGWLLAGTGMLSARQPRQRGTQLIYWDQYDFDDPYLLEKCLRLPPSLEADGQSD